MFTDTDGPTYKINQKMFMKFFLNINTYLTLVIIYQSFLIQKNEKVIGKMKDEFKVTPINKFIGLKSKMYCIVSENDTVKGVDISIEFKEHENVLFNKKLIRPKMRKVQSNLHKIGTYDVCEISLSWFDDKRYVLNDGHHIFITI